MLGVYAWHITWLQDVTVQFSIPSVARRLLSTLPASAEVYAEDVVGVAIVIACLLGGSRRSSISASGSNARSDRRWPWSGMRSVSRRDLASTILALASAWSCLGLVNTRLAGLVEFGGPATRARALAVRVLVHHWLWAGSALHILGSRLEPFLPRPGSGSGGDGGDVGGRDGSGGDGSGGSGGGDSGGSGGSVPRGSWLTCSWRAPWLRWTLGGYFASVVLYSAFDSLAYRLLPPVAAEETVVSRLLQPEGGDRLALAIGGVGPCLTAPAFEEVLYRGFALPALLQLGLPLPLALPAQAALFGLHHCTRQALLPLALLGWLWGALYAASGNLLVPVLVHALWNGRIFLEAARFG